MTTKDLTAALIALSEAAAAEREAKAAAMKERGAAEKSKSSSVPKSADAGEGGAIASPLTETAYSDRTFYAPKTSTSTDGIWVVRMRPIKSIKFKDKKDNPLTIDFKDPA